MVPIHMLYRGLRVNPNGEALVDAKRRLTCRQLVPLVEAVAAYLQQKLPEPQARIGICAQNSWQHAVAMLGVFA